MNAQDRTRLDEWMLLASRGDQAAFQRFYDLAAPYVLAFLVRMLGDRFQAEDVLQDAMVTAWAKASDFDPERAASTTWVTTIARRRALDLLRSSQRYNRVLREQAGDITDTLGLDLPGTEHAQDESSATAERLKGCFSELKQSVADCIKLAYLDGMTFPEIAARTEQSLNTVKSWIRRGMTRLRRCMQS